MCKFILISPERRRASSENARREMDGSVEGDIPELSYSPIVVAVYLVWVGRSQLYLLTFLSSLLRASSSS